MCPCPTLGQLKDTRLWGAPPLLGVPSSQPASCQACLLLSATPGTRKECQKASWPHLTPPLSFGEFSSSLSNTACPLPVYWFSLSHPPRLLQGLGGPPTTSAPSHPRLLSSTCGNLMGGSQSHSSIHSASSCLQLATPSILRVAPAWAKFRWPAVSSGTEMIHSGNVWV